MSGSGPDVFIMRCDEKASWHTEQALFQIPEQAIESGLFLPLDDYIENAQFIEWDKLTPIVMEAGRNEEGQLILPLTYNIPITFFRAPDVSHTPSKE